MSIAARNAELKRRLIRSAVKLRRFSLGHRTANLARAFVGGFDNRGNWRMAENGEATLIQRLALFLPEIVFDVGANVGDWSTRVHDHCPGALIHAFEPVPSTAEELRAHIRPLGDRVVVHELALGAEPGSRQVSLDVAYSTLVSMVTPAAAEPVRTAVIKVERGDDFCEAAGIDHIALLKIDTEGADHLVLAGFERMLARRRIDVVQFEYGVWALDTKFLLRDFSSLFDACGYVVGRLFPRGVMFGPYEVRNEDFRGLNFVAVRADRREVISSLSEH